MSQDIRDIIRRHSGPLEPIPTGLEPILEILPGIRAVLFDVYGTLLISGVGDIGSSKTELNAKAFAAALTAMDIPFDPKKVAGVPWLAEAIAESHAESQKNGIQFPEVDILSVWRSVLEQFCTRGVTDRREFDDHFLRRLAVEYEVRSNPVWPMPGCRGCLKTLQDAGFVLGVVSNAQFFTQELFPALMDVDLDDLGFRSDLLLFSYRHLQAKPGLFLFERARKTLSGHGIAAGETLYIGNDMLNDVYAASQVGFRTALFAGDRRSLRLREGDSRLEGIVPDLVLTELSQLLQCLPSRISNDELKL